MSVTIQITPEQAEQLRAHQQNELRRRQYLDDLKTDAEDATYAQPAPDSGASAEDEGEATQAQDARLSTPGYRQLSEQEQAQVQAIRDLGAQMREVVDAIATTASAAVSHRSSQDEMNSATEALRWASTARTHMQTGLMCLTRAVTRPDFF